jgi:VanZ family protein
MGPINRHYTLAFVWTCILIVLSVISKGTASKLAIIDFFGVDKLAHLIFYAVLSWLWVRAMSNSKIEKSALVSFLISTTLGVSLEFIQKYCTDGRSFEYDDMIANLVGTVIGLIIYKLKS